MQVGEINVKIGADTNGLNSGIDSAENKLGQFDQTVSKTSTSVKTSFGNMAKAAAAFAAVYAAAASSMKGVKMADEFNLLETRVRTATKATGDFSSVFNSLTSNAMASGASLEGTVSAFQSISAAGRDLGKTNQDAIQFVDTFQKLGAIGGASTEAMKNSLTQMSQSMAGGVVRAEEFNSIIENTPEVARAMADSLGLSVGELRMMVLEGELMASDVFDAIINKSEEVNATFAEMPQTLGRASESATTAFGLMFSAIDESYQVTQFLSETLDKISGQATEIASRLSDDAMTEKAWELVDAQKQLNTLVQINTGRDAARIRHLKEQIILTQQQMSGIAAADRVSAEMDKRSAERVARQEEADNKEAKALEAKIWKQNAVLDAQMEQAILAEKSIETDNKRYKAQQEREAQANAKQSEKIALLEQEYQWQKDLAEFTGQGTAEDQAFKDEEDTQAKLEKLQEQYMSENELLIAKYEEQQLIIDEAYMNEQMSKEEHEQAMTDIAEKYADARKKLKEKENNVILKGTQGALSDLSNLMNVKNKEMFEIGKTAATANAIINTYSSATKAYDAMASIPYIGPALGAAAAAAAIAGGMANVQAIQSQSYGGGGGASTSTYSGGVPAVNTTTADTTTAAPVGGTLTVQGLSSSSLFTGDAVQAIAEELLDYQSRGGQVVLQG